MYTYWITGMVCPRCVKAVESELTNLGISYQTVALGEIKLAQRLQTETEILFADKMKHLGFSIVQDTEQQYIEKTKQAILDYIASKAIAKKKNLSTWIAERIPLHYRYISSIFSHRTGETIIQFYNRNRIEKALQLLQLTHDPVAEIAESLGFYNASYLSKHIKKITGTSPDKYRKNWISTHSSTPSQNKPSR